MTQASKQGHIYAILFLIALIILMLLVSCGQADPIPNTDPQAGLNYGLTPIKPYAGIEIDINKLKRIDKIAKDTNKVFIYTIHHYPIPKPINHRIYSHNNHGK